MVNQAARRPYSGHRPSHRLRRQPQVRRVEEERLAAHQGGQSRCRSRSRSRPHQPQHVRGQLKRTAAAGLRQLPQQPAVRGPQLPPGGRGPLVAALPQALELVQ